MVRYVLLMSNGVEDFQGIMKEIKRKDHTIKNPKYKVFDYSNVRRV